MKINQLILVNYRGFKLRNIEYFEYNPGKKTQVILGSNGSGKSSLLSELSPLPANSTDFNKNGRKEIHLSHQNKNYVLKSIFDSEGTRYYFELEGENLNPGYTVTVYRELVKQHFGYTPEIHLLMTGQTRLSTMTVNERRNWFMKISETDYTYAVKYHQRLKEKIRDLQGALKLNQSRLTQETEKCLTTEDEKGLRITVATLTTQLNTLLDHRKPRLHDREVVLSQAATHDNAIEQHLALIARILSDIGDSLHGKTNEGLEDDSIALQATLRSLQHEIVERCERIEKQQKDLDAVTLSSQSTLEEVQKTIRDLEEEIETVRKSIVYPFSLPEPRSTLMVFEAARPSLEAIVQQLTELPRKDYSRDRYLSLTTTRPVAEQSCQRTKAAMDACFTIKQQLEQNRDKGQLDCPQCHHVWYRDYDETSYRQACAKHTSAIEAFEKATLTLVEIDKEIELFNSYYSAMQQYARLRSNFVLLEPYWNMVDSKLSIDPSSVTMTLQTFSIDLQYHVKAETIQQLLSEKIKLEKLILGTKQLDRDKLEKEITQENQLLLKAQQTSRDSLSKLNTIKTHLQLIKQVELYESTLVSQLSERKAIYYRLSEDSCVAALDEIIRSVKLLLSQHERSLSQIDIQRAVVKNLEDQITGISGELKLLKMAQKALSPSEGLIAKGMTGFINHFVKQINRFIATIWLYPLELTPVVIEDDEGLDLDYRFSVKVNDTITTPDVAKTSRGMREIIDLAFVAVSMKYLGLSTFPIFLDEFAITFDTAHRQSAYEAIEHLINATDYSQVYIVSHYANGYNSLTDSEILVLCDSNVQLPTHLGYNQHAILK